MNKQLIFSIALMACAMSSAYAFAPGDHVKDFTLTDASGQSHELYKMGDKKAIVIMTQGNACPIVRLAVPALREIRDKYRARGVEFILLNPNLQDTPETVTAESKEYDFDLPILMDSKQAVGEAFGVTRTAEVFVIDPKTWKLAFHGSIDDRLNYEAQRPVSHHYLVDALDAVLAGKPVAVNSVNSPGCLINFPNRKQTY